MKVVPKSDQHNDFIRKDLISLYGSEHIISIKRQYYQASELDGYIVKDQSNIVGVLLYNVEENQCELVYIHSIEPAKGIGRRLVSRLNQDMKSRGIGKIWVITTNDNLEALAFYQKLGFKLSRTYQNAMDKVREIKPMVPLIGMNGIPLNDMLELEMKI